MTTSQAQPRNRDLTNAMIGKLADQLEFSYGVKVLASRIVGSHLWGYADDVSDYDVQFVFVRPLNDYLGFLPHKQIRYETTFMTPGFVGHADVFAFDIQDFVRLMSKTDMVATQFLRAPSASQEAICFEDLRALSKRTFEPNLLIRKYLGHSRASYRLISELESRARHDLWNAVRALVFAYQLRTSGDLSTLNVFEAAKQFTPSLNLEMGPNRIPVFDMSALTDLLADTGSWDLSYTERTEEEAKEFNILAQDIIRRFANPDWS